MNAYLNYLIEANLGLALLLLVYVILLRKENEFKTKRLFMLVGIFASVIFPFFHLQNTTLQTIPSIGNLVSAYWLPEILITGEQTTKATSGITLNDVSVYLQYFYVLVLLFFLIRFLIQFISLIRTITKSKGYQWNGFQIVESDENQTTFSFFNFIFIGQAGSLSVNDKNKIIQHETVHAKQLHSIDIVLLNVLGIFFWFNPLIKRYKKIFVQLHEFEADARAVESTEVNEYCNLLAKVALQSADYTLANHFNQSLTLKRIEMMRTIKHKIKPWKIISLASVIFFLFFIVACQDQLADINEIARNSTNALVVPENVQARFDQLKAENPNSNYILVEFNEKAQHKLAEMEKLYGNPSHMELFTPDGKDLTNWGNISVSTDKDAVIEVATKKSEDLLTYAIIKYDDRIAQLSESTKQEGDVFSVVDDPASPRGGMPELTDYILNNLNYPDSARKNGIQGKVFIEFIVNTDGSISDVRALKGLKGGCTAEAIRVMKGSPLWNPGKLSGKVVRQKMVMPFNFQLSDVEGKPQKVGVNFLPPIRLFKAKVISANC